MTDRCRTLTVILDDEYRDDDLQPLADAIARMRGVVSVEMGGADPDMVAMRTARHALHDRIWNALHGKDEP